MDILAVYHNVGFRTLWKFYLPNSQFCKFTAGGNQNTLPTLLFGCGLCGFFVRIHFNWKPPYVSDFFQVWLKFVFITVHFTSGRWDITRLLFFSAKFVGIVAGLQNDVCEGRDLHLPAFSLTGSV